MSTTVGNPIQSPSSIGNMSHVFTGAPTSIGSFPLVAGGPFLEPWFGG
jgi:hypothetical protein